MITKTEITAARAGLTIAKTGPQERDKALRGIIIRIYALKGLTIVPEVEKEVEVMAAEMGPKLALRFPYLTPAEIYLAWEEGASGGYGSERRLTVANMYGWLSQYVGSEERREAVQESLRKKPVAMLDAGDVQRRNREAVERGLRAEWVRYRDEGVFSTMTAFAANMYDHLDELGRVHPRQETRDAARAEAVKLIKDPAKLADEAYLDRLTKRVLLQRYFEALKARNQELRV